MASRFFLLFFAALGSVLFLSLPTHAQRSSQIFEPSDNELFRPKIQLGAGVISYFGDVGRLDGISRRHHLNTGYSVMLRNPINEAFELNVFALFGNITAEERLPTDLYNFRTYLRMGGASLTYNFNHFLPKDRGISPFVSLGITTFEFNPKSDRLDAEGRSYFHHSDGTVMNLPEGHADISDAVHLTRNFDYETDLRSAENGHAPYSLRSISVPVGAGVDLKINENFSLRLAAEYHFTTTDYLDGIAYNSETGAGRKGNDRFLYSNFGITYNLHHNKKIKPQPADAVPLGVPSSETDEDGDGIADFYDFCPGTPEGVETDARGCPLDTDGDGVPDYLDLEPHTPEGHPVNSDGVALTEEDIAHMHRVYLGEVFAVNYEKSTTSTADVARSNTGSTAKGYTLTVKNLDNLTAAELSRILSIREVKSRIKDGRTEYYMGEYSSTNELVRAAVSLESAGLEYGLTYRNAGRVSELSTSFIEEDAFYEAYKLLYADDKVTFRVQIGAFSKPVSPKLFKEIPNVLVIPGADGLTRYISGSYDNMHDAAAHRVDLLLKGYEGAFVTAYKKGNRISLEEGGATMVKAETGMQERESKPQINKDFVSYAVQLGTFKGRIPAETLSKYMALGNVRPVRSDDGTTRYLFGTMKTMEEAKASAKSLGAEGFTDVFVVGEFNGEVIGAGEAFDIRGE